MLREEEDVLMNALFLDDRFKKYAEGDYDLVCLENENLVLTMNVNLYCVQAFRELAEEGIILFRDVPIWLAIGCGDFYNLPYAQPDKKYRSRRWRPAVVIRGPNFPKS